ncbi:MAG: hypothetical protein ABI758_00625 [Candidatus Woesebacteria bacterium]
MIPLDEMKKRFVLVDPETMKAFTSNWKLDTIAEKDSEEVTPQVIVESYSTFIKEKGKNATDLTEANLEQWLSGIPEIDRRKFENFFKSRLKSESASYIPEDEVGTFRAYNSEGSFVIGIPIETWENISEQNRETLMREEGSIEKAKKFVEKATWLNMVLHEIVHIHQDDEDESLPLWLKELQAYWVGRELVPVAMQYHTPDFDRRADAYQKLLDKYNDLQSCLLSLNRGKNQATVYHVKKEISDGEVKKLFPHYRPSTTESLAK